MGEFYYRVILCGSLLLFSNSIWASPPPRPLPNHCPALERENAALKDRVAALQRQIDLLERSNAALKTRNSQLESQNLALTQQNTRLDRENLSLREAKSRLEATNRSLSEANQRLDREVAALRSSNSTLRTEVINLRATAERLRGDLTQAQQSIRFLEDRNRSLDQQVQSLIYENTQKKLSLDVCENRIFELESGAIPGSPRVSCTLTLSLYQNLSRRLGYVEFKGFDRYNSELAKFNARNRCDAGVILEENRNRCRTEGMITCN